MIRVTRGSEPIRLKKIRDLRLARAIIDHQDGKKPTTSGYDVARDKLYESHHKKCVFCEQQQAKKQLPVEHFRPKNRATGNNQPVGEPGYWWLTWTWENLLFACNTCNSGYKSDQFPLEDPDTRLEDLDRNLGNEKQTLIDPVAENPLKEIQFVRLVDNWMPQGRDGSSRGQETVNLLGLNVERIDLYNDHVENRVKPLTRAVQEAIDSNDAEEVVQARWEYALGSIFAELQPYHSLSYWALRELFSDAVLEEWGLTLDPPGETGVDPPSSDVEHPEWGSLPEGVQVYLRAMGGARAWIERALLAVCGHEPQSAVELVALTGKSEAVVTGRLEKLVTDGLLLLNDNGKYVPVGS